MSFVNARRRTVLRIVLATTVVAGTGAWLTHAAIMAREQALLRHAGESLAWADSLERALRSRAPASITAPEALAALYLERLRLGLGSPFRLIDQAARDKELGSIDVGRLTDAMLARTMIGDAYLPRSAALDLVAPIGRRDAGLGAAHQEVIDSVVASDPDPRVGELTVRLAYRLAAASGALSGRAPELATAAASQARDRILAMRDARAIISAADRDRLDHLTILRAWRETRRLMVERPVLLPLGGRRERAAVADLPALVARLEAIGAAGGEPAARIRPLEERRRSDALAMRMAAVAASRDEPPIAPVTIAVRSYAAPLAASMGGERVSRLRFLERAAGEATLAAEYVLLSVRSLRPPVEADAALLASAVALRQFAQDRAWLPGDNAPTTRDLLARYGVAITWEPGTRSSWRPFLQHALESAIIDMKRVLPGFDPRGLRVHFGSSPLGDRALAMHDPIGRVIYFPPASSQGVMAHEFAHDLDWQAARREYGGGGWYRTDHALRQASDRLAGALRRMASATRVDSAGRPGAGGRPTEMLARNADWFVSAALAREGRMNGYLSAAQDPVITGFASAITPEAARDGGSATVRALDGLTSVPPTTGTWFNDVFGSERKVTVHEAVRRVLEASLGRVNLESRPRFSMWSPETNGTGFGDGSLSASWSCLMDTYTQRADDPSAVRAVMQYAAESRARGVVRQWAAFARRRPDLSPSRLRALTGPPWDPALSASTLREVRDAILWSALTPRAESGEGAWEVRGGSGAC